MFLFLMFELAVMHRNVFLLLSICDIVSPHLGVMVFNATFSNILSNLVILTSVKPIAWITGTK